MIGIGSFRHIRFILGLSGGQLVIGLKGGNHFPMKYSPIRACPAFAVRNKAVTLNEGLALAVKEICFNFQKGAIRVGGVALEINRVNVDFHLCRLSGIRKYRLQCKTA